MPNQNIFCNSPWYELHVYWDGSLGFCCAESHKIYKTEDFQKYNINSMTIKEWYNSQPMKDIRLAMFGDKRNSICRRCYIEEDFGSTSRRHKANQKSVIFTKTAFKESFTQSPHLLHFEHSKNTQGETELMPVDIHIDLGNHCNLACKMCNQEASSTIASQLLKWGDKDARQFIGTDWTRNEYVWNRVINEIASIKNLKNIHFMGGETIITKRFEDFVDRMIEIGRTDLNFSFVTNGTIFNHSLMKKLSKFNRVGIEISVETWDERNAYIRQGTDQKKLKENIELYKKYSDNSQISITLRSAVSLLSVGNYPSLLRYCFDNKLMIKSLLLYRPSHLDIRILPKEIKNNYLEKYKTLMQDLNLFDIDINHDYNESDPNQIHKVIKKEIQQCINVLTAPDDDNSEEKLKKLVDECRRWDKVYNLDAREYYPEFAELLNQYEY